MKGARHPDGGQYFYKIAELLETPRPNRKDESDYLVSFERHNLS